MGDLIEKEIDNYVSEYWKVAESDWESWIDAYDENGSLAKYPWPSKEARDKISANHKKEDMSCVTSTLNVLSRQVYFDIMDMQRIALIEYAKEMNTIFTINIKEEPNQKGEYEWANSYVMLSPLPKGYDHKNWTIKFNDKSEGLLKFTLLAHNNMGYPMKISLFKTKENYENNKADRSYTMKIIKSTNLNLTLRSEENIDYSGTYKGSMYVTESQKKYPVTTTVTLKNEFEDGAMYKIETRNDETGSTYIKGE